MYCRRIILVKWREVTVNNQPKKNLGALLLLGSILSVLIIAGCSTGGQSHQSSVTPTTGQSPVGQATATMNTGGTPTIGGPEADFQKLRSNGNCPGSAAGPDCFCATLGESSCDYSVTIKVADSAVDEVDITGLTNRELWTTALTFSTCHLYMGGATAATVGGRVTKPGIYLFNLGSQRVSLDITPPSCQITI
jgi:hypothetical protein